jgi:TRAP-type C4-dicarboxylate transport system substrate-binding protein
MAGNAAIDHTQRRRNVVRTLLKAQTCLFALAAACLLPATAVHAAEYRMLSSWDRSNPAVAAIADTFVKNVETASKGNIKIHVSGPETVPAFEQLQPVAAGAFHFLYTHGAYHFGTTPMLAVSESLGGDVASRRASGVFDEIDKHYQKLGVKIIAFPMTPDGAYHLVLRQPIGSSGDLSGRKVRGTPSYYGVFRLLNASPVGMPPSEIYTSLDKGVVDGTSWPVLGALGYRWYEVAKYMMRPAFGFSVQPILINLRLWNSLGETDRKILLDEGRKVEDSWFKEAGRLAEEEEKELLAKGMSLTQMGAPQRAKLRQAWGDGLWETSLANEKNRKDVEQLRQFARQKKLLD